MASRSTFASTGKTKNANTQWLGNAVKSVFGTGVSVVEGYAPNVSAAVKSGAETSRSIVNSLRRNASGNNNIHRQLQNNKYVKFANSAFKNALDDLRSGKLNNTERDPFGNATFDDGIESGMSFGDDGADVNVNIIEAGGNDASFAITSHLQKQTEATLRTSQASMNAMIAMNSASMMQTQQLGAEVVSGINAINQNLGTLIDYNNKTMTKFIESSMAFYEKVGARFDKKSEISPSTSLISGKDIIGDGKFNMEKYKQYVKQQFKSVVGSSQLGMINELLDDQMLQQLAVNPIGAGMTTMTRYFMPKFIANTIKGMDAAFADYVPKLMREMGAWSDQNASGVAGTLKKYIGQIFGVQMDTKTKYNRAAKLDKGPVPFDGVTRTAITQVIPKELREQTALLKMMAEKMGIQDVDDGIKSRAKIFNYQTGTYGSEKDVNRSIADAVQQAIIGAYQSSDLYKEMNRRKENLTDTKQKESLEATMNQFFVRMEQYMRNNKNVASVALDKDAFNNQNSDINAVLSSLSGADKRTVAVLRDMISSIASNNPKRYANNLVGSSMRANINRSNTINGLDAIGMNMFDVSAEYVDKDGNVDIERMVDDRVAEILQEKAGNRTFKYKGKSTKKGTQAQMANGYENTPYGVNWDFAALPAGLAAVGAQGAANMFGAFRSGNVVNVMETFGKTMMDGAKVLFDNVKTNFLDPMKDTIFGIKDEHGYSSGGMLSGVQNYLKDTVKGVGSFITGRDYVDSKGQTQKAKFSLVGEVKEGIMTRLFGEKDADTGQRKQTGIFSKVKESILEGLEGWRVALFGEEESPEETKTKVTDFLKERFPDAMTGATLGAGAGIMSGGLLGTLVGGPLGGAILGAATGFAAKSQKFQEFVFGVDIDGEKKGGLISDKTQKFFKEHKSFLIGGAALGMLKGTFLGGGGGFLGTLVGGPVAGALMGLATATVLKSKSFHEFLFGDDETGQTGIFEKIKRGWKSGRGGQNVEKFGPGAKALGMSALGGGAGGLMGMLVAGPYGSIVGAGLGLVASMAAQADNFKSFLFGDMDENGNKTREGLFGQIKNMVNVSFIQPVKNNLNALIGEAKDVVTYSILDPIRFAVEPIVSDISEVYGRIRDKIVGAVNGVGQKLHDTFIQPILNKVDDFVLTPIRHVVNGLTNVTFQLIKHTLLAPVKIMTGAARLMHKGARLILDGSKSVVARLFSFIDTLVGKPVRTAIGGVAKTGWALGGAILSSPFRFGANAATRFGDKLAGIGQTPEDYARQQGKLNGEEELDTRREQRRASRINRRRANREDKVHIRNAQIIAKATGYQYADDSKEARRALQMVNPKEYKRLTLKDSRGNDFGPQKSLADYRREKEAADMAKRETDGRASLNRILQGENANSDSILGDNRITEDQRQTGLLKMILDAVKPIGDKVKKNFKYKGGKKTQQQQTPPTPTQGDNGPAEFDDDQDTGSSEERNATWLEDVKDKWGAFKDSLKGLWGGHGSGLRRLRGGRNKRRGGYDPEQEKRDDAQRNAEIKINAENAQRKAVDRGNTFEETQERLKKEKEEKEQAKLTEEHYQKQEEHSSWLQKLLTPWLGKAGILALGVAAAASLVKYLPGWIKDAAVGVFNGLKGVAKSLLAGIGFGFKEITNDSKFLYEEGGNGNESIVEQANDLKERLSTHFSNLPIIKQGLQFFGTTPEERKAYNLQGDKDYTGLLNKYGEADNMTTATAVFDERMVNILGKTKVGKFVTSKLSSAGNMIKSAMGIETGSLASKVGRWIKEVVSKLIDGLKKHLVSEGSETLSDAAESAISAEGGKAADFATKTVEESFTTEMVEQVEATSAGGAAKKGIKNVITAPGFLFFVAIGAANAGTDAGTAQLFHIGQKDSKGTSNITPKMRTISTIFGGLKSALTHLPSIAISAVMSVIDLVIAGIYNVTGIDLYHYLACIIYRIWAGDRAAKELDKDKQAHQEKWKENTADYVKENYDTIVNELGLSFTEGDYSSAEDYLTAALSGDTSISYTDYKQFNYEENKTALDSVTETAAKGLNKLISPVANFFHKKTKVIKNADAGLVGSTQNGRDVDIVDQAGRHYMVNVDAMMNTVGTTVEEKDEGVAVDLQRNNKNIYRVVNPDKKSGEEEGDFYYAGTDKDGGSSYNYISLYDKDGKLKKRDVKTISEFLGDEWEFSGSSWNNDQTLKTQNSTYDVGSAGDFFKKQIEEAERKRTEGRMTMQDIVSHTDSNFITQEKSDLSSLSIGAQNLISTKTHLSKIQSELKNRKNRDMIFASTTGYYAFDTDSSKWYFYNYSGYADHQVSEEDLSKVIIGTDVIPLANYSSTLTELQKGTKQKTIEYLQDLLKQQETNFKMASSTVSRAKKTATKSSIGFPSVSSNATASTSKSILLDQYDPDNPLAAYYAVDSDVQVWENANDSSYVWSYDTKSGEFTNSNGGSMDIQSFEGMIESGAVVPRGYGGNGTGRARILGGRGKLSGVAANTAKNASSGVSISNLLSSFGSYITSKLSPSKKTTATLVKTDSGSTSSDTSSSSTDTPDTSSSDDEDTTSKSTSSDDDDEDSGTTTTTTRRRVAGSTGYFSTLQALLNGTKSTTGGISSVVRRASTFLTNVKNNTSFKRSANEIAGAIQTVNESTTGDVTGTDTTIATNSASYSKMIIVGDSRTVDMANAMGAAAIDTDVYARGDNFIFIAKNNMGYNWLNATACDLIDSYVSDDAVVVFWLGVHDCQAAGIVTKYSKLLKEKAKRWGCAVYYMGVGACSGSYAGLNSAIESFNESLKHNLTSAGIGWVPVYEHIKEKLESGDYICENGLRYDAATYQGIFNFMVTAVGSVGGSGRGHGQNVIGYRKLNVGFGTGTRVAAATSSTGGFGVPYYSQNDSRWKHASYGSDGATMGDSGCGPTAAAMVASSLSGKRVTPTQMASAAVRSGDRDSTGTNSNFFNRMGSTYTDMPSTGSILSAAKSGPTVLLGQKTSGSNPYTKEGHYVVADGVDKNGMVNIKDPRGSSYNRKYSASDLSKSTASMWGFGTGPKKWNIKYIPTIRGGRGEICDRPWLDVVKEVKENMCGPYSQSNHKTFEANGKTITARTDCSGFVFACLYAAGYADQDALAGYTGTMHENDAFMQKAKDAGFTYMAYENYGKCKAGDILVQFEGSLAHAEIFAGNNQVWDYGISSKSPTTTGIHHTEGTYNAIWRPSKEILEGAGGTSSTTKKAGKTTSTDTGYVSDTSGETITVTKNSTALEKIGSYLSEIGSRSMDYLFTGKLNTDFSNVGKTTTETYALDSGTTTRSTTRVAGATSKRTTKSTSTEDDTSSKASGNFSKLVVIGDSRTVGMAQAVGAAESGTNVYKKGNVIFVALVGAGYSWFGDALSLADKYVNDSTAVVCWMGVNDCQGSTYSSYASALKARVKKWKCRGFYMSVGPCKGSYDHLNSSIENFNTQIKKELGDLGWIDVYSRIKSRLANGQYSSSDGLHYSAESSKDIYNYMVSKVGTIGGSGAGRNRGLNWLMNNSNPLAIDGGRGSMPYFSQNDPRWSNAPYGDDGARMSDTGCGPTAAAMVASSLTGTSVSPTDMASSAVGSGDRDGTGTNRRFFDHMASRIEDAPTSDTIKSMASSGPTVLLGRSGFGTGPFTSAGHYVVADGIDDGGNVNIKDPRGTRYNGKFSANKLARQTSSAWGFGGKGPTRAQVQRRLAAIGRGGFGKKKKDKDESSSSGSSKKKKWLDIVAEVKKNMASNYDQGSKKTFKANGKTITARKDCSGFVYACLFAGGYCTEGDLDGYTGTMHENDPQMSTAKAAGFKYMSWPGMDNVQAGDIMVDFAKHTEIYAGNSQVYNFGSNSSAPVKGTTNLWRTSYDGIWRPSSNILNGTGTGGTVKESANGSRATNKKGTGGSISGWISACRHVCGVLSTQDDWRYGNKGDNRIYKKGFDWYTQHVHGKKYSESEQLRSGYHLTQCAFFVVFCLQVYGVIPIGKEKRAYGLYSPGGETGLPGESWDYLKKYVKIIYQKCKDGNKTFGTMLKNKTIIPGDICFWGGHMSVYAGQTKTGKPTFYDGGSGMTTKPNQTGGSYYGFGKIMDPGTNAPRTIVRLKLVDDIGSDTYISPIKKNKCKMKETDCIEQFDRTLSGRASGSGSVGSVGSDGTGSDGTGTDGSTGSADSSGTDATAKISGIMSEIGERTMNYLLTGKLDTDYSTYWNPSDSTTDSEDSDSDSDSDDESSSSSDSNLKAADVEGNDGAEKTWLFLKDKGMPEKGIAGLMGNIASESGFKFNNLENQFEGRLGNDESYTKGVNNKTISKDQFLYLNPDSKSGQYGYGLVQWTSPGRKEGLYANTIEKGRSIDSPKGQLEWLWEELSGPYSGVKDVLMKKGVSVEEASTKVLGSFEEPANWQSQIGTRASNGQGYYEMYGNGKLKSSKSNSTDDEDTKTTTKKKTTGKASSKNKKDSLVSAKGGYGDPILNGDLNIPQGDDDYYEGGFGSNIPVFTSKYAPSTYTTHTVKGGRGKATIRSNSVKAAAKSSASSYASGTKAERYVSNSTTFNLESCINQILSTLKSINTNTETFNSNVANMGTTTNNFVGGDTTNNTTYVAATSGGSGIGGQQHVNTVNKIKAAAGSSGKNNRNRALAERIAAGKG